MERGPTENSTSIARGSVGTRSLGLEALAKGAAASITSRPIERSTLQIQNPLSDDRDGRPYLSLILIQLHVRHPIFQIPKKKPQAHRLGLPHLLNLNPNLTHPSYSLQAVAFSLLLSPPPPDRQYSQTHHRQHRAARLRNRPRIVQHDALVVLRESQ